MQSTVTEDPSEAAWFGREDPDQDKRLAEGSPGALLAKSEGLRAPPAVASKVLSLTQDPNASFVDLRIALEQDPALCAQLVRMANTALYATRVRCSSLDDAIMRLGTGRVRSVAAGLVAMGSFGRETDHTRRLRVHGARVGAICEVLGREWRGDHASDLFLTGIVHDLGKLAFLEASALDYTEADGAVLDHPDRTHPFERQVAGFDHAALGATVLESWLFPPWITRVVELHHDPGVAYGEDRELAAKVAILRLADQVEYAMHSGEPAAWERLARGPECTFLSISEDVLGARWVKLEAAVQDMGSLFE